MIKSLRKKFVLINMILVFLILSIVLTSQFVSNYNQAQNDSKFALERALMRNPFDKDPQFEVGQNPPENFSREPVFVVGKSTSGDIEMIVAENIYVGDSDLEILYASAMESERDEGTLSEYNLRYMVDGEQVAFIDMTTEKDVIQKSAVSSIATGLVALFGFFIVSLFLSRWALKPVEKAWMRQRQFIADASHELRTPLTVILANLDLIEEESKWVESTKIESERMKTLLDDMLFLAKSDEELPKGNFVSVNFSDVVANSTLTYEAIAFEKGLRIDVDIEDKVFVSGNSEHLKQLIAILMDNAIKYSESGSSMLVKLYKGNSKIHLQVTNYGEVIPVEHQQHIFERFYRTDESRTAGGHGLGLSIAKSIVELHGGDISVSSGEASGTTFSVTLSDPL